MIALLLSTLATAAILATARTETLAETRQDAASMAALVAAHPGHETGDYAGVRADLMSALERAPESPWAALAVAEIDRLDGLCAERLDLERMRALIDRVTEPLASLRLRRAVQEEVRRRRFAERPAELEGDLWHDFVREWRLIGPLGRLDHPAPLRAPLAAGPEAGPSPTYRLAWGEEAVWRPLRRAANSMFVQPSNELPHAGRGLGYLLAYVRSDAPDLALEVLSSGPRQVFWNGALVHEKLLRAPAADEDRALVAVTAGPGWNVLLLRVPNERQGLSARILGRDGQPVAIEELPAGSAELPPTAAARAAEPLRPAPPGAGIERVAWMLDQIARGRPDRALAAERPEDEAWLRPWLRARFRALENAGHLPGEVRRRAQLELEAELEGAGGLFPEARAARAARLAGEDKPAEALLEVEALVAEHPAVPAFHLTRIGALSELDPENELARAGFADFAARFPEHAAGHRGLAGLCAGVGDFAGALDHWRRALAAGGNEPAVQQSAIPLLARAGGETRAWLLERLAAWRAADPGNDRPGQLLRQALEIAGDEAGLEAELRAEQAARPHMIGPAAELARFLAARGRAAEARALFAAVLERSPGEHGARGAMALYGLEDPAERFFAAFAPDREEALGQAGGARDASTAELLDSGMLYLYPDGSSHQRFHTITLALDRKGTELLHEQRVAEHARLARILKAGGRVIEPVEVNGSWVMPELDAGDAVELVWDEFTGGVPGAAPELGWWRFASFEKPFVRSRYAIYVPDGLPGELAPFRFDGAHEERRWEGGTVHVFLARDVPRQREEPLRPSYEEILPWLQYGADRPLGDVEALWRERLDALTHVPADLAVELDAALAGLPAEGRPAERAAALYRLVTERVIAFEGGPFASQVWHLRRGEPTFLFGALLARAGVPFEWAVLERGVAPELDPAPVQAFANQRGFDVAALRFDGDEPVWHVGGGGRGARFGALPDELAGARALVLGPRDARLEELPRDRLEDSWDTDLAVTYTLAADGSAAVTGRWRMSTAQGAVLREQIAQVGAEQRQRFARSAVGQLVPGLDLTGFDFPGLEERGGDMVLAFEGRVPGFVQERGGEPVADLRVPPTHLSTGLGAAQRIWPLALRTSNRDRVRVRLVPGPGWRVAGGPAAFRGEREGFLHALEVEPGAEAWEWRRLFLIRGLFLPAEELGGFLEAAAEREREESRPVRLERAG